MAFACPSLAGKRLARRIFGEGGLPADCQMEGSLRRPVWPTVNFEIHRLTPAAHTGPADLTHSIVERDRAIPARSDLPPKNLFVEFRRPPDICRRHLNVTDLAVTQRWRHILIVA